jgi:hypothetical protein
VPRAVRYLVAFAKNFEAPPPEPGQHGAAATAAASAAAASGGGGGRGAPGGGAARGEARARELGEGWVAAQRAKWAGLKPAKIPVKKGPAYENARIQAPDGVVLCTCGKRWDRGEGPAGGLLGRRGCARFAALSLAGRARLLNAPAPRHPGPAFPKNLPPSKVEWYLARGLATLVTAEPLTIRLHFEPRGRCAAAPRAAPRAGGGAGGTYSVHRPTHHAPASPLSSLPISHPCSAPHL